MTKNPIAISPNDTVGYALDIMNKFHISSIPVIYIEKIMGIITKYDIYLKSKSNEQKVSDIMSKSPLTISPDDEIGIAADIINRTRINALIVAEDSKLVGIITRNDIDRGQFIKIEVCEYCHPRGDKTKKEIFRCTFCNDYFCIKHFDSKIPTMAPFKSTDPDRHIEWEKDGHPCFPYFYYLQKKEKEKKSNEFLKISKPEPIIEPIPEPEHEPIIVSVTKLEHEPIIKPISKPKPIQKPKAQRISLPYKISYVILIILLIISALYCYNTVVQINSDTALLKAEKNNLSNLEDQINEANTNLYTKESTLLNFEDELNSIKNQINSVESILKSINSELAYLRFGKKYYLHNPTYTEVINFLKSDRTDSNTYSSSYTCTYFSKDVNNNAEKQGIRCAFVSLDFAETGGHAIVAFYTIDKGLVYFEPQSDDRAYVSIGEHYWENVEVPSGYYREAPDYDDTVTNITYYW